MSGKHRGDLESKPLNSSYKHDLPEGSEKSNSNKFYSAEYDAPKSVKHWGEFSRGLYDSYTPDVTEDIEKSMNKFCLAEFDADYDSDHPQKSEQVVLQAMDPLILYAVSLHKYANDLTDMIRVAELPSEDAIPPLPEVPEIPDVPRKHVKNSLNYIPKDFTPFSLGHEIEVPELSEAVVKQILIKCVATMTAHIGFETTHQSVLDLLTDVLEEFLLQISKKLKTAWEDEDNEQLCGFPNIAERVLIEMGMGGIRGLHDYYQARVIKYINVLRKRCTEDRNDLNDRYAKLLIPKSNSPIDKMNKIVREKVVEEAVNEAENPEIHFSTIDGEVGLSLETGFQLLNSLEAETNLQTLVEAEEDLNVNASPGVLSIPETDIPSHLSPFTKKKRTK